MTTNSQAAPQQITDDLDFELTIKPQNNAGQQKPFTSVSFSVAGKDGATAPLGALSSSTPDAETGAMPKYVTNGPEVVVITCTMEADPEPGKNTLVETLELTIVASEDTTPGLGGTAVAKA